MSLPEILEVRAFFDGSLEITLQFNDIKKCIRSVIDYTNLYDMLEEDGDIEPSVGFDEPSQSDWRITTNVPELKLLCKYIHYHHMTMSQEVSDYIDDHFEERLLDKNTSDELLKLSYFSCI